MSGPARYCAILRLSATGGKLPAYGCHTGARVLTVVTMTTEATTTTTEAGSIRWLLETRTCDEFLRDWGRLVGSITRLEKLAGLTPSALRVFLTSPMRRFREPVMVKLRDFTGLPIACQLQRGRRICDVIRDELASGSGDLAQ